MTKAVLKNADPIAKQDPKNPTAQFREQVEESVRMWNEDNPQTPIGHGINWSNIGQELFETYINKYLFPKINSTSLIRVVMNDRFAPYTVDTDVIGQFFEEYIFTDIVPTQLKLDNDEMMNLRRNYAQMRTKLYREGNYFKYKFTANDNDFRLNWSTFDDAIKALAGIYNNMIDSFNIWCEKSKKATIIDYALHFVKSREKVDSMEALVKSININMLDMQDKTTDYNEADTASGNPLTEKTMSSNLEDILIITDTKTKEYMLNSIIANTFANTGLDLSNHIMSFKTLGGTWITTDNVVISDPNTISKFTAMGMWEPRNGGGLHIPKGSIFTFDVSKLTEFADKAEEYKPKSDYFAFMIDTNGLRFRQNTKGMAKKPIYLQDTDEWQHMFMFYAMFAISPFAQKHLVYSDDKDVSENVYVTGEAEKMYMSPLTK